MRQRGKQKFHTIRDMCHHVHHRRDRQAVKAILFDEIRTDQVLTFRELFQANQYLQQLGSSVCNLYTYSVWVYHIAMILCTNNFDLNNKSVSEAERSWLKKNAIVVQLSTPACSAAAWLATPGCSWAAPGCSAHFTMGCPSSLPPDTPMGPEHAPTATPDAAVTSLLQMQWSTPFACGLIVRFSMPSWCT